jgi:hypothetical protein
MLGPRADTDLPRSRAEKTQVGCSRRSDGRHGIGACYGYGDLVTAHEATDGEHYIA